jgi:TolA-binding protein
MRRWALLVICAIGLSACWGVLRAQDKQPVGKAYAPPNDLQLVERVLASRKEYQKSLETLREHYLKAGDVERQRWVEDELLSFHRISKRAYRLDLDVPPPTLQPAYTIPEANELFKRAMSYKGKGWFTEAEDNLRRAELLFQQLLSNYPQSDKIDDSAYQLGEIYESRTFKQYRRSAMYYERCFQWNPNTETEARLRAARLYDKTLQERARAMQLYRDVLAHDTDQKRLDEAKKRLTDLSSATP